MARAPYEVVHEDDDILVINKSPGALTIPDRYDPHKANLLGLLGDRYGKVFVVHRLDRETSGILVFARTAEAHKMLSAQFQDREADKFYLALTTGTPFPNEDLIDKPIGRDPRGGSRMRIDYNGGKPSATAYEVLESYREHALLRLQLFSGRTHQIRVHLASIGHPLAVDPLYGGSEGVMLSELKRRGFKLKNGTVERPLLQRVSLHAYQLAFDHPGNGERAAYSADPPKDFRSTIRQLQKWARVDSPSAQQ